MTMMQKKEIKFLKIIYLEKTLFCQRNFIFLFASNFWQFKGHTLRDFSTHHSWDIALFSWSVEVLTVYTILGF